MMMSEWYKLFFGLAAFTLSCHAQIDCGRPYPSRIHSRFRRQAGPPNPNTPPTEVLSAVPYSRCGVVVISERYLLTAAYCVLNPSNPVVMVRLGDLDLSQNGEVNSRPADYGIEHIVIHPNFTYNPETGVRYSDLALLKTDREIEFNEAVFPLCMSRQRPTPGTTVIGSGFGFVNKTHKATHLQEGDLNVMSARACEAAYQANGKLNVLRRAYPGLLEGSGVICAGHPLRGVCKGDEGGPLMREDQSGRRFIEGIISFTDDNCEPGMLPTISVSIADHYDFIMEVIRPA